LTDRDRFISLHGRWCLLTGAAVAAAVSWYVVAARGAERWPGGSSLPGLVLGAVASLIILFEFALWPRRTRWFRTARWLGSAELWMKAHLWLGLLSLPLVLLHSGFRLGGTFSTVLALCFFVVIASGVGGLLLQNLVPRLLWEQVPRETIFGEIAEVARQYASDGQRIVALTCGEAPALDSLPAAGEPIRFPTIDQSPGRSPSDAVAPVVRAGALRQVGTEVSRERVGKTEFDLVPLAAALSQAFQRDIGEYLLTGASPRRRLGSPARNKTYFAALRPLVASEAWPAVDALADLCEARRQLDSQRRWHLLLHGWLWFHLPLSAALVVLVVVHVVFALRYG